jgi:thioredoxin reductase (NADPH)
MEPGFLEDLRVSNKPENVVIIGSGPAAFTAAIYAARAELSPLVFEGTVVNDRGEIPGGQLMTTTDVENFPGFPEGVGGGDLMDLLRRQAQRFDTRTVQEDVTKADLNGPPFRLTTSAGEEIEALSVIVATGARAKKLNPKGSDTFWQNGVSACAVCDGALPMFRDKPLAVIGGGDTAMEEAAFLTKYASKVYIIHRRDEFRASKIMQERVLANPKVEVVWCHVIEELHGGDQLEAITLISTQDSSEKRLEVGGLFYAIGHVPNTAFLEGQLETNETGYIVLKKGQETSRRGVFAAGDVHDYHYRQAITAAGAGCAAALDAEHYLAGLASERPDLFEAAPVERFPGE